MYRSNALAVGQTGLLALNVAVFLQNLKAN